jgi:hypothetical protein
MEYAYEITAGLMLLFVIFVTLIHRALQPALASGKIQSPFVRRFATTREGDLFVSMCLILVFIYILH